MDIVKISLAGIASVFLALFLRQHKAEYSQYIAAAAALLLFAYITTKVGIIVETVETFAKYTEVGEDYIIILLKMAGITYVAEFASSICRDSGYQTIASQIEIFARVSILAVSLPVITALIDTIGSL